MFSFSVSDDYYATTGGTSNKVLSSSLQHRRRVGCRPSLHPFTHELIFVFVSRASDQQVVEEVQYNSVKGALSSLFYLCNYSRSHTKFIIISPLQTFQSPQSFFDDTQRQVMRYSMYIGGMEGVAMRMEELSIDEEFINEFRNAIDCGAHGNVFED